jgi:23S rRNA (cytosine1962-C5)-methyltransferase
VKASGAIDGAAASIARVVLKPAREGPARGGNPWIFSNAIARIEPGVLEPGKIVEVVGADGSPIGLGYYNPKTTIAVRLIAGESGAAGGFDLATIIERRIRDATAYRLRVVDSETDCYRLLNGEGDGLPGVVADRYADIVVIQLLTAGADRMRGAIVAALNETIAPRGIIERSAGAVRRQEGLEDRVGPADTSGTAVDEVIVHENGIRLAVDLAHGQKTGAFLDQRDNRMLARRLARDARCVLDACCYGGGFALAALAGGARRVVAIDTSMRALGLARRNLGLNGHDPAACAIVHGEVARYLVAAPPDQTFDLIILDPPPLARSVKDAVRASHLYLDLNALAMRAVAPRGHLLTFSCSVHFRGDDFVRAVRMAAAKAHRTFRIAGHLGPGADHPVLIGHAEGEYLTGLWLSALD